MTSIISSVLSVFFMAPILGFVVVFVLLKLFTKDSRKSVKRALDYTTILFIISVHFLIVAIWGISLIWLIFLLMVFFAMVLVILNWRVKGEIFLTRVFKGVWRLNFIFFFTVYITLTIYGLIESAIQFTITS